jgi:hypothetical protein
MQYDLADQPGGSACWATLTPPASSTSLPSATARACSTAALMPSVTNV